MEVIGLLWNEIIVRPMTNGLLMLHIILFQQFGLAIIAFTILTRILTYPLTIRQLRQTKRMTALQPRIKEIQERYKGDPQRRSQETMRMYKESGVNPIGCLGPFVIQIPIFIGLFYAIRNTLPFTPESLAGLADKLYIWLPNVAGVVPVDRGFLWLDLALKDPTPILPLLAGASMWVQQKMMMSTASTADPKQQSTQRMMLWMMPIFFVILSLQFPSGLVLYWVASNLIGIVIQYFVTGWGGLSRASPVPAPAVAPSSPAKELVDHGEGQPRNDEQDSRRGNRARDSRTRRRSRGGRNRRR